MKTDGGEGAEMGIATEHDSLRHRQGKDDLLPLRHDAHHFSKRAPPPFAHRLAIELRRPTLQAKQAE
jgi:hypothetical protein